MRLFPVGMCQCGCGKKTSPARHSDRTRGWVKGEPLRFVPGHGRSDVAARIERRGDCWQWVGPKNQFGYGRITRAGRTTVAHRFIYERLVGVVPDGLQLDHLCRNRACVNPEHLEPVTAATNLRRGLGAKSSAEDVAEWLREANELPGSQRSRARAIAARHGVPESRVRNVLAGRTWSFQGVQ